MKTGVIGGGGSASESDIDNVISYKTKAHSLEEQIVNKLNKFRFKNH